MYKPVECFTLEVLYELRNSNLDNIKYIKSKNMFDATIHDILNHLEEQIIEINEELIKRGVTQ